MGVIEVMYAIITSTLFQYKGLKQEYKYVY